MIEIIQQRKVEWQTEYVLYYQFYSDGGSAFPCNEQGEVDISKLPPEAVANYNRCRAQTEVQPRVEQREFKVVTPRIGRCVCGQEVHLTAFTNTCDCGRDYNMEGSELAPRQFWGEETGEHWTECL